VRQLCRRQAAHLAAVSLTAVPRLLLLLRLLVVLLLRLLLLVLLLLVFCINLVVPNLLSMAAGATA
jgi:hypothetical protein